MISLDPNSRIVSHADVAIVGYGPVGATLANLLGSHGISTLVLEREAHAYALPRAVHFDDEVMRVFQTIGLADRIAPLVRVSPGMRFVDSHGQLLLDWSRPVSVGPQGWFHSYRFHQPDLERVLREGAARWPSVTVRNRCEAFAVNQDEDAALVFFEDLSTGRLECCRAKYVIGCDGARSLIRRLIGSGMEDLGFHERWLVIDVLLKGEEPDLGDHSIQFCDPQRPATYVRGTGNRRRWEITVHPSEDAAEMSAPHKVWELLSKWVTPEQADLERAAVYTFHSVIAESWRSGRMLIAGDSAHQTPPFLGQGMCAGIRDVGNLAWKLIAVLEKRAEDSLLDTYQSERIPHVRAYIELAVRLGGLINTRAMQAVVPDAIRKSGQAERMQTIKPKSGPGLLLGENHLVGTIAPQPRNGYGILLDDIVGYGFAVLRRPGAGGQLVGGAGIPVIDTEWGELDNWLAEANAEAVLVRPDRCIMGTADSDSELDALLAWLGEKIQLAHGCR